MQFWFGMVWFFFPYILSCVKHNGSLISNCHGIKDTGNCNVSKACFVLEKLAVINIGSLGWAGPHPPPTTPPSVLFGTSVCAPPFPSPSIIPFCISPGHLGCGRLCSWQGPLVWPCTVAVDGTIKPVPVCGRWLWPGNQPGLLLKPNAPCLALTREVSSSPLLKLSLETAFLATNQYAAHFCGIQMCKQETSAQALLPGVGMLPQRACRVP